MDQGKTFKWRSFVSFGMFFSFLIMSVSGLILYLAPPGRVFRWLGWELFWIDLNQWQALHTLFSYLFLGFAISHVFSMNWKILFSYFTRKTKAGLRRKRELLASSIVVLLFAAGTLLNVPPFQSVMQLGDWASDAWGEQIDYPPVSHIEKMTIEEIATVLLDVPAEVFMKQIKEASYRVDRPTQSLEEVCTINKVDPYVLFRNSTRGMKVLVIPEKGE
ncbi:DUF4405 domain-containing protein [Roseimarinus sediminis]|uniref:DUF4405 domain-containing protein n=1 Tax=Roseimarinus sediminis TaxID=1610899 RepID=UPI003D1E948A